VTMVQEPSPAVVEAWRRKRRTADRGPRNVWAPREPCRVRSCRTASDDDGSMPARHDGGW